MHPSGAGEEMQSTFNGYTKRHLGLYHWQAATSMSAGFVSESRLFDVDFTRLSLSTVAHHQGFGSVTRTSHELPNAKLFALVPLRWTLPVVNVLQVRISLKSYCVLQSRIL